MIGALLAMIMFSFINNFYTIYWDGEHLGRNNVICEILKTFLLNVKLINIWRYELGSMVKQVMGRVSINVLGINEFKWMEWANLI